jgi:hypothetical protein
MFIVLLLHNKATKERKMLVWGGVEELDPAGEGGRGGWGRALPATVVEGGGDGMRPGNHGPRMVEGRLGTGNGGAAVDQRRGWRRRSRRKATGGDYGRRGGGHDMFKEKVREREGAGREGVI